ncbi:MAG: TauD/TfdA family dioxygenase [Caulobacterales bacterium]|nr:TauD/TfdA family dioxygenase [Caulobacterales bacterium]
MEGAGPSDAIAKGASGPAAAGGGAGGERQARASLDVNRLWRGLRHYPYYIVARTPGALDDPEPVQAAARALASRSGGRVRISFTRVHIDRDKADAADSVTRYSRTHLALPPHTDSSYMDRPHELVVFQCVTPDRVGGETQMAPIDDILRALDDETAARLRDPVFPFGDARLPILNRTGGRDWIRYYSAQLTRSLEETGVRLDAPHREAARALDALLDDGDLGRRFHLSAGDILFMNNTMVLHGRTGFEPTSERLIFRVRAHVDGLTPAEPDAPPPHEAGKSGPSSTPAPDEVERTRERIRELMAADEVDKAIAHAAAFADAHPQDVRARLAAADLCERADRPDEALAHYRTACEIAPDDADAFEAYADLLLQVGRFDEALEAYRRCRALDPTGYESGLSMSAILRERGEMAEARAIIGEVVRRHPIVPWNAQKPDRPTILRARGFENASYGVIQDTDGDYVSLLQGGHFSIKHMLPKRGYNLQILNIFEDNTDHLDDVPDHDLVLNAISCADLEPSSLLALARFLDARPGVPVVNHPRRVYDTTRDRNFHRLSAIEGVRFPRTERVRWEGGPASAMTKRVHGFGFEWPVIVRVAGSQTGLSVGLIDNDADLEHYFEQADPGRDYYIIQYVDCRNRGVYNKTRIFCIDGRYYPVANLFVDDWSVHSGDRYAIMDTTPWTQELERAYLEDPVGYLGAPIYNALKKIRDIVQLDFFGIDFTVLADGAMFIFELNPAMRHNYDHAGNFPYTRPHLDRISAAFNEMVQRKLGEGPASA